MFHDWVRAVFQKLHSCMLRASTTSWYRNLARPPGSTSRVHQSFPRALSYGSVSHINSPSLLLQTRTPSYHHRRSIMTAASAQLTKSRFLADENPPICGMDVDKQFALLTTKEKLYAHYLSKASWAGARIIQGMRSRSHSIWLLANERVVVRSMDTVCSTVIRLACLYVLNSR